MKTHGMLILAKETLPEPQIVGCYSERNVVAAIPDSRPSNGYANPQDKPYARLRGEGWLPKMGCVVLEKDGQLAVLRADGVVMMTADSHTGEMSRCDES